MGGCHGVAPRPYLADPFSVNVVVTPYLSEEMRGRAECIVTGSPPFALEWSRDGAHFAPDLDEGGMAAKAMGPGVYAVRVLDAQNFEQTVVFEVPCSDLPRVSSYAVTHASGDLTRDGTVAAVLRNIPEGCRYLWTNQIVTTEPTLHHVRPGVYSIVPLARDGRAIPFVHACAPAVVRVL